MASKTALSTTATRPPRRRRTRTNEAATRADEDGDEGAEDSVSREERRRPRRDLEEERREEEETLPLVLRDEGLTVVAELEADEAVTTIATPLRRRPVLATGTDETNPPLLLATLFPAPPPSPTPPPPSPVPTPRFSTATMRPPMPSKAPSRWKSTAPKRVRLLNPLSTLRPSLRRRLRPLAICLPLLPPRRCRLLLLRRP